LPVLFSTLARPPISTLFPYTTLFRSCPNNLCDRRCGLWLQCLVHTGTDGVSRRNRVHLRAVFGGTPRSPPCPANHLWKNPAVSDLSLIRNFSIIAHIDHGKSTLADRFIQVCGGLAEREMSAQVLDSMDLERERGITIKAQAVSLRYRARDGRDYELNLIDTPGHVDFSYEVSRSLAACEGAILIVDAAQGVEAQSVANCYTAVEAGLEVIPVINKIDLPPAEPARVKNEIQEIIGIEAQSAVLTSAKTGQGVEDVLDAIIARIPPPRGDPQAPLQALIIDSWFDNYVGVVSLVRVVNGVLEKGAKVRVMSTGRSHNADKVGCF